MSWSLCLTLVGRLTDMMAVVYAIAPERKTIGGIKYATKSGVLEDTT